MKRKTPASSISPEVLELSELLIRIFGAASKVEDASDVMSPHAVRAAIHLAAHGEGTIGTLAEGLGISQGWASRVVEEMQRSGHVLRTRDEDDRRVVRIRLTPEALREMERTENWRGSAMARALDGFTGAEREVVRRFLERAAAEMEMGAERAG